MIKSHVLYRLSYELPPDGRLARDCGVSKRQAPVGQAFIAGCAILHRLWAGAVITPSHSRAVERMRLRAAKTVLST